MSRPAHAGVGERPAVEAGPPLSGSSAEASAEGKPKGRPGESPPASAPQPPASPARPRASSRRSRRYALLTPVPCCDTFRLAVLCRSAEWQARCDASVRRADSAEAASAATAGSGTSSPAKAEAGAEQARAG